MPFQLLFLVVPNEMATCMIMYDLFHHVRGLYILRFGGGGGVCSMPMVHNGLQMTLSISMFKNIFLLHTKMTTNDTCH